jgi:hypothetical protein
VTQPKRSLFAQLDRQALEPGTRYMTTTQVCGRYSSSPSTITRWTNDPDIKFPRPLKIAPGGVNLYDIAELDRFDARRAALMPELNAQASERGRERASSLPRRKAPSTPLSAACADGDSGTITAPADLQMSPQQLK